MYCMYLYIHVCMYIKGTYLREKAICDVNQSSTTQLRV